jgi:Transglycosylase SLT domain
MNEKPHSARRVSAVLFGIAFCLSLPGLALTGPGEPPVEPTTKVLSRLPAPAAPGVEVCLATTLCALKDEVRWRTPAWSPGQCQLYAEAVQSAAEQHGLSPALILAVMLNESDLDEKAVSSYERDGAVYAKDGGLMGIRCVFDQRGRCKNGFVKGMTFKNIMDPFTNIALGARELAYYRHGGGVEKRVVRVRGADGVVAEKTKNVRCGHATHAYWAHYNHGSRYIDRGQPRHYPHRVAVLYYALARALSLPLTELETGRITVVDHGLRPRTADRPVEPRYRALCSKIQAVSGVCRPPVTAFESDASPAASFDSSPRS